MFVFGVFFGGVGAMEVDDLRRLSVMPATETQPIEVLYEFKWALERIEKKIRYLDPEAQSLLSHKKVGECLELVSDVAMINEFLQRDDITKLKKSSYRGHPPLKTTALHIAAKYGDLELVETLLKKGANKNCFDGDGKSPLQLAWNTGYGYLFNALMLGL